MIHVQTGAEVAVRMKYNRSTYTYGHDAPTTRKPSCTCPCNCGISEKTPQPSTSTSATITKPSTPQQDKEVTPKAGTPKSLNRTRLQSRLPSLEPMVVENMPGKTGIKKKPPVNRVTGKCQVCKRVYESKEDLKFRKGKMRKRVWVGCEKKGCKWWVHAECGGLDIGPKDNIEDVPFFCFQHRE